MIDLLTELEEYFESKADADHNGEGFEPNKEMRLLIEIKVALKYYENERYRVINPGRVF